VVVRHQTELLLLLKQCCYGGRCLGCRSADRDDLRRDPEDTLFPFGLPGESEKDKNKNKEFGHEKS
jgi:hypothetical protein